MECNRLKTTPTNIKRKKKSKLLRSNYDLLILCVFILLVNSKVMSHGSLVVNCFLFCICQERPIKYYFFVGKAISVSPQTQRFHPALTPLLCF